MKATESVKPPSGKQDGKKAREGREELSGADLFVLTLWKVFVPTRQEEGGAFCADSSRLRVRIGVEIVLVHLVEIDRIMKSFNLAAHRHHATPNPSLRDHAADLQWTTLPIYNVTFFLARIDCNIKSQTIEEIQVHRKQDVIPSSTRAPAHFSRRSQSPRVATLPTAKPSKIFFFEEMHVSEESYCNAYKKAAVLELLRKHGARRGLHGAVQGGVI